MFIASKKRKENIAEYLLYMWQVEDIIRACNLDIEKIDKAVIAPQGLSSDENKRLREWYESLIDMMKTEGVEKSGHLQINRNVVINLTDFHNSLLNDDKQAQYRAMFYAVLPYIVELRSKAGDNPSGEIETCFNLLYATLLLRLQKREISKSTTDAVTQISRFIATLAALFHEDENANNL